MAKTVREIMNRELFSLRPSDDCEDALGYILALGITGAPVVDESRRPVGMVSFRDLLARDPHASVELRMTRPAITVDETASIEEAARRLSESGVHRLAAVDDQGRAVGLVSSLDVIRGLLGLPASHPATFPHYDAALGISWTDDTPLEIERLGAAPDGPGVFALVRGGRGMTESVVWAETARNVRTRLYDVVSLPQEASVLEALLRDRKNLRFRAAAVSDAQERMHALRALLAEAHKRLEAVTV